MFCDDDRSKLVPESTRSGVSEVLLINNSHEISQVNICRVIERYALGEYSTGFPSVYRSSYLFT